VGALRVPVRIGNPADRSGVLEVELLVDTGATFTVVPSDLWRRLRLEAEFTRQLRTADGRALQRSQGLAYLEVDGHAGIVPVIEGADGDIPVLGVTSLEILGLAVDPVRGELRPSEHLYL